MKKAILLLGIVSLCSLLLAAEAKITFEKKEINFGEIDDGQSVDLVFEFQNTGDSLLVIKNIRAACGCTTTQLKKKQYKPGEKGAIPVKFMSRGYGGRKVFKTITVNSNDPSQPAIRLKIAGKVELKNFARLEVYPKEIIIKIKPQKKQYVQKFYIKNTGNIDLEIIELIHIPEILPIFSSSVIKPGHKAEVEMIFKPLGKTRNVSFLKIRSNDYRQYYALVKILLR